MKSRNDGVSRREIATALMLAAPALAQQPAASAPEDLDALAAENRKRNREQLRSIKIPIATEPSFAFHP